MDQNGPLTNRIVFGLIAAIWTLAFVKLPYLYSLGRDVPALPTWTVLFLPLIVGLVLITIKGNVRLRLDKIWTPTGLVFVFWAWLVLFKVDVVKANGDIMAGLLSQSSETYLCITGFGLLLAFVDFSSLYRYAYWFVPFTIFEFIFLAGAFVAVIVGKNIIPAVQLEKGNFFFHWGLIIDGFLWYASGPIFAYIIIKKLKADQLGWKKIASSVGKFIAVAIVFIVIGSMAGSALPENNWFGHWLKGDKPSNINSESGQSDKDVTDNMNNRSGKFENIPNNTCPDSLVKENQLYALINNQKYLVPRGQDIYLKNNCPDLLWP